MESLKREEAKSLKVFKNLTVLVFPNSKYEFLMTSKEVAKGYSVSVDTIRRHKERHSQELIEGKHFINSVQITHGISYSSRTNSPTAHKGATKATMWTKRGIVRLGFFIRSSQAIMFRDWAEDLIIDKLENTELLKLVEEASTVLGSQSKLAARLGVNPGVITHIRNSPHLVSAQMQYRIEMVCKHILTKGTGVDFDFVRLLIKVEDAKVREALFNKFMEGGVL